MPSILISPLCVGHSPRIALTKVLLPAQRPKDRQCIEGGTSKLIPRMTGFLKPGGATRPFYRNRPG